MMVDHALLLKQWGGTGEEEGGAGGGTAVSISSPTPQTPAIPIGKFTERGRLLGLNKRHGQLQEIVHLEQRNSGGRVVGGVRGETGGFCTDPTAI